MGSHVTDHAEQGRFELDVDGQTVFARYVRQGSTLVIPYVEAHPLCAAREQPVGSWQG
jgi:hypothetical protein